MPRVIGAETLPRELIPPLLGPVIRVVPTQWVERVGTAHQESAVVGGGQNSDVVLAVVLEGEMCD